MSTRSRSLIAPARSPPAYDRFHRRRFSSLSPKWILRSLARISQAPIQKELEKMRRKTDFSRAARASILILSLALFSTHIRKQQAATPDVDLLIVGAGISGLSAALEAARGGARVLVVDMASVFGGHAVMSEGGVAIVATPLQQASGIADSPELAFKDFTEWGEDANVEWVRYYVQHSRREIYDWLTAMGTQLTTVLHRGGNSVPRFHQATGRGLGLVSPLYRECVKRPGITFVWNTQVTGLIAERGRITGARSKNLRTGETRSFHAAAVI